MRLAMDLAAFIVWYVPIDVIFSLHRQIAFAYYFMVSTTLCPYYSNYGIDYTMASEQKLSNNGTQLSYLSIQQLAHR